MPYPSVCRNHLQQSVCVGGFQLRQHPVFQYVLHDGMLAPQLFQHIRIGAPAGFGFLSGGQHEVVKEDFPQLLWRQDVEFMTGMFPDSLLQLRDAVRQAFAEFIQRTPVHQKALLFHVCQHPTEGKLSRFIELRHLQLRHFFL